MEATKMIRYQCPLCDALHSVGDWNDTTSVYYHGEIATIQSSEASEEFSNDFVCPTCGVDSCLDELKKCYLPLHTNESATILLKGRWEL